jgi:hypothetical protein
MKYRAVVPSTVVMLVAVSGCSSAMMHSSDVAPLGAMTITAARGGSSANRVGRAELAPLQETPLDAALSQLRPEWFRVNPSSRQISEPARASVYIDNAYSGDLGVLRLVPVSAVIDVSFLGPSAARDRFGVGCPCAAGAILVVTRNIK